MLLIYLKGALSSLESIAKSVNFLLLIGLGMMIVLTVYVLAVILTYLMKLIYLLRR